MSAIGARVRARREALGLTQRALAELAGMTSPALSRLETGAADEDRPRSDDRLELGTLRRLATALEMTLDELAGEKSTGRRK